MFFEAEKERVKKIEVILLLNQSEERREKKVVFVHTAVFERARNWCVEKFFLRDWIFFVHVRFLKAVFCIFDCYEVWLWYCLLLGLFW